MARWSPVNIAGGAYSDDARPWSCQDTVNYIPVPAEREGTRSSMILRGAPGFTTFCATMQEAPVRGLHNVEGLLLAVAGSKLYSIGTDGAASEIGTVPGVRRVTMAHNQVEGGHEVMVANGQSGYVYKTTDGSFAQVTDEAFTGFKTCDFVDGYIVGIEPSGRYAYHSDLLAAGSYSSLDRFDAESAPDKMVALIVSHREVLVLNERSGAFFRNSGSATGTFQNSNGMEMEVGCAATHAVARLDNTVYWLGHDGIVYRLAGHQPQRVSTGPVEQAISRCDAANAFAFTFEDRGHKIFYLTFPDGATWGYDVWTGEWHRRQSKGLDRWRLSSLVRWNGVWIGGDFSNGRLYQLDWAVQHEAGEELMRRRVMPVLHDNANDVIVNALRLIVDTGLGSQSNPRPEPVLPPLSIAGNLPDGQVGEAITSFTYSVSGGVLAYGARTITAGSLPPGLSMDAAGTVTGTPTGEGGYSWTVSVTDAAGTVATVEDSAEILSFSVFAAVSSGTGNVYESQDILTWSTLDQVSTGLGVYPRLLESHNGLVFAIASSAGRVSADAGATWESCTGIPSLDPKAMLYVEGLGYLLIVSSGVNAYLSTDGRTFAPYAIDTTARSWHCAAINGDKVVIGASNGNVRVSLDRAVTFQTISVASGAGNVAGAVPVGDGFVAVTSDGSNAIHKAADGLNWTPVTHPAFASGNGRSIAKWNDRIVAVSSSGFALVSTDAGASWVTGGQGASINGTSATPLICTRGHFMLCGQSGKIQESETGAAWTELIDLGGSDVLAICAVRPFE